MNKELIKIKLLHRFTGHKSGVYALETKPDSNILWSGSGDQIVAEWDIKEETDGAMLAKSTGIVYALRYIAENNHLLIGQSNGGVHVINLKSKAEERLLQYHSAPIFYIAYHLQHALVFTYTAKKIIINHLSHQSKNCFDLYSYRKNVFAYRGIYILILQRKSKLNNYENNATQINISVLHDDFISQCKRKQWSCSQTR